jgi:nicotinamidase-related amidase
LQKFRDEKRLIIHIQHISKDPNASFFVAKTHGAAIHPSVSPEGKEKIIVKHYPNSFRDTELLSYLKSMSTTDLVICGMMTHMCVDSTTRAANDLGFKNILIADACATTNITFDGKTTPAQEAQTAFMGAIDGSFATVQNTETYLKRKFAGVM